MGPHTTPGKVYECSEFQNGVSKKCWVLKNFENPRKQNWKWAKKINIVSSKIKFWKIEQQLKVEKEDEREAPW